MLKHNKKRNSYIVYEQLLSLASRLSIAKQREELRFVVSIISDCFNKNSLLFKEKKLFESILKTKGLTKEDAGKVLDESIKEASTIDYNKINQEKERMVNIISKQISGDVFDIPVKEYKTLASVQILFNESRNASKVFSTPVERVKIKTVLTERMCKKEIVKSDEKIDSLTYSILLKQYNEKYSKLINEDQKDLLRAWLNYGLDKDKGKIDKVVSEKVGKIKTTLGSFVKSKKISQNENFGLIKEAYEKISTSSGFFVKNEDDLYTLMKYFDLKEDLEAMLNE